MKPLGDEPKSQLGKGDIAALWNATAPDEEKKLRAAASRGEETTIRTLLESGVDVSSKDSVHARAPLYPLPSPPVPCQSTPYAHTACAAKKRGRMRYE